MTSAEQAEQIARRVLKLEAPDEPEKSIMDKLVADLRAGNCSRWWADCWAIAVETAMMVLEELTTETPA